MFFGVACQAKSYTTRPLNPSRVAAAAAGVRREMGRKTGRTRAIGVAAAPHHGWMTPRHAHFAAQASRLAFSAVHSAPADAGSFDAALFNALPAAERVLALGDGGPALERAYREHHPQAAWCSLAWSDHDGSVGALAAAAVDCDLVVVTDRFASAHDVPNVLRVLAARCAPGASLVFGVRSETRLGDLVRLAEGDLSVDAALPSACRALASMPSAYKLLMDAGWMPHCAAPFTSPADASGHDEAALTRATQALADVLQLPRGTLARTLAMAGGVVQASRTFGPAPLRDATARAPFAVVVPVTRGRQLDLNVLRSPGLAEIGAPIVAIRDAESPADALARGLAQTDTPWLLLCHQDVYFPEGFGARLAAVLESIAPEAHDKTLIGFAGMSVDAPRQGYAPAGFVIDRLHRIDQGESPNAVSIDELAIVVSRRTLHRIDPAMGWHLWATDLCLAAICEHRVFARILRLPLFHNSVNDYSLPAEFHASARTLAAKFPAFGPIPTLCGTIDAAFLAANAPVTAPTVLAAPTRRCVICEQPVESWLAHPHIERRSDFMKLLDAVGSDLSVYQCPSCGCTDRDRHLWLYMGATGLTPALGEMRVLHIAPERHLEVLIERAGPKHYVRGDKHPHQRGHLALDVEALGFADGSFELIICNHVLEHVDRPAVALAELYRCLRPGGLLIAQTPYAPKLINTLELSEPVTHDFATRYYDQADHVRLFGADISTYFHAAGFPGEPLTHDALLPDVDPRTFGCNRREPFFAFEKPDAAPTGTSRTRP